MRKRLRHLIIVAYLGTSCAEEPAQSSIRYEVDCPRCIVYYAQPGVPEQDPTAMSGEWSLGFLADDNFVPQLQARYASHQHNYDSAKATIRILYNDQPVVEKTDSGHYFIISGYFIR